MKSPDSQNNSKGNSQAKLLFKILRPFLVSKAKDEGTFLVITVMLGLLFMVLSMLAIDQGSANKTIVAINEKAQQSESIAEGGVSNLIAALSAPSAKPLLLLNHDPNGYLGCTGADCAKWTNATEQLEISGYNNCGGNTSADKVITLPINSSGVPTGEAGIGTSGKYKLLGYRFVESSPATNPKSGTGRLYIKGRLPDSTNSANSNANSTLEVQFPVKVTIGNEGKSSALVATDMNVQQSDVHGDNIICTNPASCPLACTTGALEPTFSQLRASIGASSGSAIIQNLGGGSPNILVGIMTIPPIPAVPVAATVYDLGTVSTDITLPRVGDVTSTGPEGATYYYQIADWDKSAILINTTDQVRIYVSGFIQQMGNDDLRLSNASTAPSLGQIRLYGGFSNGNPPLGSPPDQDWLISGNACTMAFIHAPDADIGVNGGGNGCSGLPVPYTDTNIFGAIWSKTYNVIGNPSNSAVFYEQPGLMNVVGASYGNVGFKNVSVGSVSQWIPRPDPQ